MKQYMVVVQVGRESYYTVDTSADEKAAESIARRWLEKFSKAGCAQTTLNVWDVEKVRAADGEAT